MCNNIFMNRSSGFASILLLPLTVIIIAIVYFVLYSFILPLDIFKLGEKGLLPIKISSHISGILEKNEEYKILRSDNVGLVTYYLIEVQHCGIDFTKLCSPDRYFYIGMDLHQHPVIYAWFIEIGQHLELMRNAGVKETVIDYFDFNKSSMGRSAASQGLKLEKIGQDLYLSKIFSDEVFQGHVLNGKLFFNAKDVIDETIVSQTSGNQATSSDQEKWQALETGDKSFCESVNDPRQKSTCMFTFAIITKDNNLCEKITEKIIGNSVEWTQDECKKYVDTYIRLTQRSANDKCFDLINNPQNINQFCLQEKTLIECALREADCSLGVKYQLAPLCEQHPQYREAVYPELCQILDVRHQQMLEDLRNQ